MNEQTQPYKRQAWIIFSISALFYFFVYIAQVSPNVMVHSLQRAFTVDATALGGLSAYYFYVYASVQIPIGLLLDRFGPRKLLTLGAIACALGCFLFATASTFQHAEIGRFFIGLGSAFAFVGSLNFAANWFPNRQFAFLTGLLTGMGMLGSFCGEAPLAIVIHIVGWRGAMNFLAGCFIIVSGLIWLYTKDKPPQAEMPEEEIQYQKIPLWLGLKRVFKNGQNWLASLYNGLMFAPLTTLGSLWGVPFLMKTYHLSNASAAFLISFMFIGGLIGAPFFGWFSEKIGRRRLPLFITAIGVLFLITLLIYVSVFSTTILAILLFIFGFFAGNFALPFTIVRETNPPRLIGTSLGFANTLGMLSGAIIPPAIGLILDMSWSGAMKYGIRLYSAGDYKIALTLLLLSALVTVILTPFMRETFCKPSYGTDISTKK